jgi:hypothetical protein
VVERADEAIFIAGVDFLTHEAEGGDKTLVTLSLEGTGSV